MSLGRLLDGEPSEPEHRERVPRELSTGRDRQVVNLDMRRRHGRKPEDGSVLDGDVGDTHVLAELVLSGELLKEAVEIGIARSK